jgi:glycosyltransferase involved in cell wall biosynthesis
MALKVIGESWALTKIDFDYTSIDDFLELKFGAVARRLGRTPLTRAIALALSSRGFDRLAIVYSNSLTKYLIVFFGVMNVRKLVLFETIIRDANDEKSWKMVLLGWFLRRCCYAMHVMVDSDVEAYTRAFALDRQNVNFVPWPMITEDHYSEQLPLPLTERDHILSSGRANCDWETLLIAARGQNWPLIIVCSAEDLSLVEQQAEGTNTTVLSEISREDHERLVKTARLYILSLKQTNISSGQIRLSHCSEFCTPMVASDVYGLRGYLQDGVTGIAVPPADPDALRVTVNGLLKDEKRLQELVQSSAAYGEGKTITRYAHALARLVDGGWSLVENHSINIHENGSEM